MALALSEMVFISKNSLSAASTLEITTGFSDTYDGYKFVTLNMNYSVDARWAFWQFSDDGGLTWESVAYEQVVQDTEVGVGHAFRTNDAGAITNSSEVTGNLIGSAANEMFNGQLTTYCMRDTDNKPYILESMYPNQAAAAGQLCHGGGVYTGAGNAINAIRLLTSGGTTMTGDVLMYGIRSAAS